MTEMDGDVPVILRSDVLGELEVASVRLDIEIMVTKRELIIASNPDVSRGCHDIVVAMEGYREDLRKAIRGYRRSMKSQWTEKKPIYKR